MTAAASPGGEMPEAAAIPTAVPDGARADAAPAAPGGADTEAIVVPIPAELAEKGCAKCDVRPGLQRLHSVIGPAGLLQCSVDGFCVGCGAVPSVGGALHPEDLTRSAALYGRVDKSQATVASAIGTTCVDSDMTMPYDLEDLGLVHRLSPAALFEGFPTDRPTLEPHLRSMLGLSAVAPERVIAAQNFIDVEASLAVTVEHVFELDADGKDRLNRNHVAYWPLIGRTLTHPFEIWRQQPRGAQSAGWAFFAAYRIGNGYEYHMVWINRRRQVRTSYGLTGVDQLQRKRMGIPIYVAYR